MITCDLTEFPRSSVTSPDSRAEAAKTDSGANNAANFIVVCFSEKMFCFEQLWIFMSEKAGTGPASSSHDLSQT